MCFSLSQWHEAGYDLKRMRDKGFPAHALLAAGADLPALVTAGCLSDELNSLGFTLSQLVKAGYDLTKLKDDGLSAAELKAAGASYWNLLSAGFLEQDMKFAVVRFMLSIRKL